MLALLAGLVSGPPGASFAEAVAPPVDDADRAPAVASVDALRGRARDLGLADERAWRRLLHYHDTFAGAGRPVSHVDDPRFFLAGPAGRRDAAAELDATIDALFGGAASAPTGADDDPRCRFVARERWLRERLGEPIESGGTLALPLASAPCAAYTAWRETVRAHSATLVFPAAYLNNPSSMFGHTLLRLDPPGVESGSDWLSWSLNFAADVGDDTPQSATYAWKGITGGYPGRFLLEPYFTKLRQYGAIENRDIHEYRLDLTPAEVNRLVEHVWELRDLAFDYYFFRENCSFRLLELLEHARPSLELAAGFPLTAIPADTVKAVVEAGLVDASDWLPSSASWLRHESAAVPTDARAWIDALARDPGRAAESEFAAIEPDTRRDVVRAANRLMTYRARREPPSDAAAERRLAMLTLLASYPIGTPAPPLRPAPARERSRHDARDARRRPRGGARARRARLPGELSRPARPSAGLPARGGDLARRAPAPRRRGRRAPGAGVRRRLDPLGRCAGTVPADDRLGRGCGARARSRRRGRSPRAARGRSGRRVGCPGRA